MPRARTLSLVGAVLCVISVTIATLVLTLGEPDFDATLLERLAGWRHGVTGTVLRAASDVGFFVVLGPVALVLAIVIVATTRNVGRALLLAGATPIAASASAALKKLFERERPSIDPDVILTTFSLPSGHATSSSAFAAALVLAAPTGWKRSAAVVVGVVFAVVVGTSRVALGVHFPTDVLAGWCLGTGVTCLLAAVVSAQDTQRGAQR